MRPLRVVAMCAVGILLTLLAAGACPDTLDALVITSAAADLATTEWALSQPGLYERNPLLKGPPERAAVRAGAVLVVLGTTRQLARHGHPRAAKVLKVAVIVLWSGAAVNNAVRARRDR